MLTSLFLLAILASSLRGFRNPSFRKSLELPSQPATAERWRLVTCTFVHSSPKALLATAFPIWVLGGFLEARTGPEILALLYISASLSAHVALLRFRGTERHAYCGAFAPAAAVLGASLLLYPNETLESQILLPLHVWIFVWFSPGYGIYALGKRFNAYRYHAQLIATLVASVCSALLLRELATHAPLSCVIFLLVCGSLQWIRTASPDTIRDQLHSRAQSWLAQFHPDAERDTGPDFDETLNKLARDGVHSLNEDEKELLTDRFRRLSQQTK